MVSLIFGYFSLCGIFWLFSDIFGHFEHFQAVSSLFWAVFRHLWLLLGGLMHFWVVSDGLGAFLGSSGNFKSVLGIFRHLGHLEALDIFRHFWMILDIFTWFYALQAF